MAKTSDLARLAKIARTAPRSFLSCRICGHEPGKNDPRNVVVRFWKPDDGWVIGPLCMYCLDEYGLARPKPEDYAYSNRDHVADRVETDTDPMEVLQ